MDFDIFQSLFTNILKMVFVVCLGPHICLRDTAGSKVLGDARGTICDAEDLI